MSVDLSTSDALAELLEYTRSLGVSFDAATLERLHIYVDTLLLWNARLSLTGARTARSILLDHVLDSLHVCQHIRAGAGLADLGSGAGFPGLPIAIVRPDARVVLVESRRKRANFLREVVRRASLVNVEVTEIRAEILEQSGYGGFDAVTSRALSSIEQFLGLAAPLLKPGGLAIAMKGPLTSISEAAHPLFGSMRREGYRLPSGVHLTLVVFHRNQ